MSEFEIFEYDLLKDQNGKVISKFAIIVGGLNSDNPFNAVNTAVSKYVGKELHNQFVDIKLNNPWTRVIISGIDKLPLQNFDLWLKDKPNREKRELRLAKLRKIMS